MFNPELELEKEQSRLEGALVAAAMEYGAAWHGLGRDAASWDRLLFAQGRLIMAIDQLEWHLRGKYGQSEGG